MRGQDSIWQNCSAYRVKEMLSVSYIELNMCAKSILLEMKYVCAPGLQEGVMLPLNSAHIPQQYVFPLLDTYVALQCI